MYNLKTLFAKIFTNLSIPSEREIRELQLRQVKCALEQSNDSTTSESGTLLNLFQIIWQSSSPQNNGYPMRNSNAFIESQLKSNAHL